MTLLELEAPAKINLSLDVLRKREDGYHELKMIMQEIKLHDIVTLELTASGIHVECDSRWVPSDSENIAYKASSLIFNKYGIKSGLKIKIKKRIPVAAGLAGGSADAAAVLKGINVMFSLGLAAGELMELGKQIGADVPYCVMGGTMLAEGIGEILTELESFKDVNIVLIKPKIGVSTAWVYKNLNLDLISARPDTNLLIKAISCKDIKAVSGNMKNVLETVTIPKYQIVAQAKNRLMELGALGSMMSGSGPSVFGIFPDRETAQKACGEAKDNKWDCILTWTQ
jgi:4-diphosphocytidyl-2-C-methyl-D-erythritol kinase